MIVGLTCEAEDGDEGDDGVMVTGPLNPKPSANPKP